MKRVILESPYAGNIALNLAYARACVADCLKRGEAAIASHLLYTQAGILDDDKPEERKLGIAAGLAWLPVAEAQVFYVDLGWSKGMIQAKMQRHRPNELPVEIRQLPSDVFKKVKSDAMRMQNQKIQLANAEYERDIGVEALIYIDKLTNPNHNPDAPIDVDSIKQRLHELKNTAILNRLSPPTR